MAQFKQHVLPQAGKLRWPPCIESPFYHSLQFLIDVCSWGRKGSEPLVLFNTVQCVMTRDYTFLDLNLEWYCICHGEVKEHILREVLVVVKHSYCNLKEQLGEKWWCLCLFGHMSKVLIMEWFEDSGQITWWFGKSWEEAVQLTLKIVPGGNG